MPCERSQNLRQATTRRRSGFGVKVRAIRDRWRSAEECTTWHTSCSLAQRRHSEVVVALMIVRSWRPIALRGVLGVSFGVLALLWPSITLAALVLAFGAYALLDGVMAIATAGGVAAHEHRSRLLLEGLVGVAAGLATLLWTKATIAVAMALIAAWGIGTGILEVAVALRLRAEIPGRALLVIAGGASIALGAAVLAWPTASAFVLVTLLGIYALFFGAMLLALALRLRRLTPRLDDAHPWFHTPHGNT